VRWAGDPVTNVGLLDSQWQRALTLHGNEEGTLSAIKGVEQWVIYFNRDGAWTNAQSSAGVSVMTRQPPASPPAGGGAGGGPGGGSGSGPGGAPGGPSPTPPGGQQDTPATATAEREMLPRGVRSVITLGPESGMSGRITRDVLVAPASQQN
jgi:general secretion pathway protein J